MIVDCAIYEDGRRRVEDRRMTVTDVYKASQRSDESFVWIGLYEPTEHEFDSLRREFDLHELAVEDAIKAHQRPKLELYGETLFVVLKTARYVDSDEVVEFGEILIFLGHDFVITVRHGEASDLHAVRVRMEENQELLRCGPGAVLHAVVDKVVDDYIPALEGLEEDINEVERDVFSPERNNPAERIFKLQREVQEFNRATSSLVEPVDRLARGSYGLIHGEVETYFRDVYDHLVRVHEQLDAAHDMLTGALQANLAQVTVRQNEDVRKISAIVAIIAAPTMIAGIYGMNFEQMPELTWELGYPLILTVMLVICFGLYRYFKNAGWL